MNIFYILSIWDIIKLLFAIASLSCVCQWHVFCPKRGRQNIVSYIPVLSDNYGVNHYQITPHLIEQHFINSLSIWNKSKVGIPNIGYQLWWPLVRSLPKLADNISSQFDHLVNTELTDGFLVTWIQIKVAHTSRIDKFEWFIAYWLEMTPSDCNHIYHTLPIVEFYI